MKALVFTTVFPNPAQPTQGLFVFERIHHLARIADVRVVAPISWRVRLGASVPTQELNAGLEVSHPTFFYVPGLFKILDGFMLFCSTAWTLRRIRREFAFDLIDAHFTFPDGFAAILLGRWFGCPVTITERGTVTQLSPYRLRRLAMGWAFRRASCVIAVAQPLADRALKLGAGPNRVVVIPNGVNTNSYAPCDQSKARRQLGLRIDRRVIVSVGRLIPSKGFGRILRVLPEVLRHEPNLVAAIVGGNPVGERGNFAELQRLVADRGLSDRVIFTGEQPPAAVALWLNAADVFVLASDMEGCPNVVWEALACGRPVVATKVGEVERMVPQHAGILLDDADDATALTKALLEALDRRWDAAAIRAHAEAHTWFDVAERVLEQWRFACDAGRSSGRAAERTAERSLANYGKEAE